MVCSFLSFIIMHNRNTPMNQFTFFNRNILSTLIYFDVYIYSIKNILSLLAIFRETNTNVIIMMDIVFLAKSIIELRNMGCKTKILQNKLLPPIYQYCKILQKNYYLLRKNNYWINDIGSKLGCYFLYDITFKNE